MKHGHAFSRTNFGGMSAWIRSNATGDLSNSVKVRNLVERGPQYLRKQPYRLRNVAPVLPCIRACASDRGYLSTWKGNAMKFINMLASSMVAMSLMAAPAVFAADTTHKMNMDHFMKACDMDKDGMMSKAEMLAHMEKMFDKMDTKKTGKLDKKQSEAFLKQFTTPSPS